MELILLALWDSPPTFLLPSFYMNTITVHLSN